MSAASIAAEVEGVVGFSLSVRRPYAAHASNWPAWPSQKEASSKDDVQKARKLVMRG